MSFFVEKKDSCFIYSHNTIAMDSRVKNILEKEFFDDKLKLKKSNEMLL
jgi:hypothetical protein